MTPGERQRVLGGKVRRARVRARQATAKAILAWWPLSLALTAWAAHLEALATSARAAVRAELDRLDQAHRAGRRRLYRNAPGGR